MSSMTGSRSPSFINSWWRLGGVAGIAWIVLFAAGMIISGDAPAYDDDAADIRAFFRDDGDQWQLGSWLSGIAFVLLLLPYSAALRGVLGLVDRSGGMWPRLALMGLFAAVILGGAASSFWGGLALIEADVDDSTLRLAMYTDAVAFDAIGLGTALAMIAAAIVILQTGVFWRWLAIIALASALGSVVGGLWMINGERESILGLLGLIGLALFVIFVLISSIAMVMRKEAPGTAA